MKKERRKDEPVVDWIILQKEYLQSLVDDKYELVLVDAEQVDECCVKKEVKVHVNDSMYEHARRLWEPKRSRMEKDKNKDM